MNAEVKGEEPDQKAQNGKRMLQSEQRKFICDRCAFEMLESSCKVICPNCGNRFDCSDLNIYFD